MNLYKAVAPRRHSPHILAPLLLCGALVAPAILSAQRAPNVDVWFDQGNEFDRGEPGQVMYSGDAGSYLTLLRVDTDGRLTVLSPRRPNDRSRLGVEGGAIPFQADPTEGVGYVFAVASRTPFDFRNYRGEGNAWNVGTLGRRGGVDPFEVVDRFARSSVGTRGSYSIAYAPYEIGRAGAGRASYQHGVRYDDGYGYDDGSGYGYYDGYQDPWGASPHRRDYDNYRYQGGYGYDGYGSGRSGRYGYSANRSYNRDPRTHYLRHCPDGTLAPYTTPCAAFSRPNRGDGRSQTRRPTPHRPSDQGPIVHQPIVHQPIVHQPIVHQPIVHQPIVHQPVVHKPVIHRPVTRQPATRRPVSDGSRPRYSPQSPRSTPSMHRRP